MDPLRVAQIGAPSITHGVRFGDTLVLLPLLHSFLTIYYNWAAAFLHSSSYPSLLSTARQHLGTISSFEDSIDAFGHSA